MTTETLNEIDRLVDETAAMTTDDLVAVMEEAAQEIANLDCDENVVRARLLNAARSLSRAMVDGQWRWQPALVARVEREGEESVHAQA
jgi:hypothetical protein